MKNEMCLAKSGGRIIACSVRNVLIAELQVCGGEAGRRVKSHLICRPLGGKNGRAVLEVVGIGCVRKTPNGGGLSQQKGRNILLS
ncbi:hypothetical protein POVCU2_0026650 [Plasmodium ovale curtisi]|uniref:Uncharacterized protein n=1 Tax=Plasmodium ovale curtisi TaxID=864141 RepID=A0A1A8W080_PLAOA|nr:hypothetical protein POVCU2_0026650 [Plasmodium ovale curtisi]SBT02039.1 hypothetical protein POVCU1_072350 [Plasmodium ovale curtisi]